MIIDWLAEFPRVSALSILAFLNWIVVLILVPRSLKHPEIQSLRTDAIRVLNLAVAVTAGTLLWLNVRLDFAFMDQEAFVWAAFVLLLFVSLQSVYFLHAWATGKYGDTS